MRRQIGLRARDVVGLVSSRSASFSWSMTPVLAADRHQHVGAIGVGARVLALDDRFGAREQLAGGERLARRRGIGKQELVELVDRLGAGELAQREVPLLGGDARLLVGAPALGFGDLRLPRGALGLGDRAGQAGDQRQHRSDASATGIRLRRTNLAAR